MTAVDEVTRHEQAIKPGVEFGKKERPVRGDLGFGANPIGKECGLTLVFGLGGS